MGGKASKVVSVLPIDSFNTIRQNKNSNTAVTVSNNIKAGYLYLVLPPDTSLNNFEKFGGKLVVYLYNKKNESLDSVCIDNTVGIHVLSSRQNNNTCIIS